MPISRRYCRVRRPKPAVDKMTRCCSSSCHLVILSSCQSLYGWLCGSLYCKNLLIEARLCFNIATRQSTRSATVLPALHYNNISASDRRAQWRSRANRRIEFTPGNPADRATVLKSNEYVTAAYAEMYLRNPAVYKWAGMAALTSAAVGRGMYMIHYLKQSRMGLMVGLFGREVANVANMLGA